MKMSSLVLVAGVWVTGCQSDQEWVFESSSTDGSGALAEQAPEVPVFDNLIVGETLAGWTGGTTENPLPIWALEGEAAAEREAQQQALIAQHWYVEQVEGIVEIVSDGQGPHLVTQKHYGDFELLLEWKLNEGGDSGIYLREIPQVQLWDPDNEEKFRHGCQYGSGGLWNNPRTGNDEGDKTTGRYPAVRADNPVGEWNALRIVMVGDYVNVWLNGRQVVTDTVLNNFFANGKPPFATGRIHLQTHGSETRFRNIQIREISQEEAAQWLPEIKENVAE